MNIAEILKYCSKGTKLYSPIYGDVILDGVFLENRKAPIVVKDSRGWKHLFTEQGYYTCDISNLECILFPSKDQRDWGKFRLPFKAGDIVMTIDKLTPFIFKEYVDDTYAHCYCGVDVYDTLRIEAPVDIYWTSSFIIPASEEAKKELFDKMAEAGYRWNADTLELERTRPKFKEGDVVIDKMGDLSLLSKVEDDGNAKILAVLFTNGGLMIHGSKAVERDISMTTLASIKDRNRFFSALVKEGYKYDKEQHKLIKQEFKPFDRVLVRNSMYDNWISSLFSHYNNKTNEKYPFVCINDTYYRYCMPYEGNEYLLDTANSPT
jgi:hypothetical protein